MGQTQPRGAQYQLGHLTNDPNYQQILRQLYANNPQQIINDYPQYLQNQDQHPNRFKHNVDVKKVLPILNDTYIQKNSIQLVQIDASSYRLEFIFDCSEDVILTLYIIAKETLDNQFITKQINALQQQGYEFKSGQKQKFSNFEIDIRKQSVEQLTTVDNDQRIFPLLIEIAGQEKQLYQYCYFKITQEDIKIITLDIKIQRKGKAFSAKDVYGGQKDCDDKECVICLTQKINTIILPCKHMSLCSNCCQGLMERSSKCPICRNRISGFRIIQKQMDMI